MGFNGLSSMERCMGYCSSWSTSLFVTGHVSRHVSGHLLPGIFLPLMSIIGKMEWNLIMFATESNIWGETRSELNIMLKTQRMLVVELNSSTHIIWLLSRPQDVLARALDKPNFHIVNLLLVIHGQYQGFAVGVYGAVSYQKCSILMWFMWVTNEDQFR